MIPGQEAYLFNKVKSLPDDAVIVEIGSYKGRSTVAMAMACIGTKRKIYCIDTWNGNDRDFSDREFFGVWQQNIKKNGVDQYVVPLQGFSHEVLKRWYELTNTREVNFIFIDGSHQYLDVLQDFQLSFPLVKNGGWIAFHDVIHTWPGSEKVWHKIAKYYLVSHEYSSSLACGQKDNSSVIASFQLPIHFFTIVLNGEPFIRYHIEVFKQLPFPWHWHIVEGVADLKHDTAWSSKLGGHISDEIHRNGYSKDGTTDYLDELVQEYPDNITVYRKPEGVFWDGKLEMVNAPLANIHEECLLWQIDVDELWTVEQLCTGRHLFISNPEKTAGFYWCWYFVGENLVISTRNCYAQNPQQDWLRTWRFKPGMMWAAHEPPVLIEPLPDNRWRNVAEINPFLHEETEERGLVFQHFAYTTSAQLQFKEQYYGYKNAVSRWTALQEQAKFPVLLRQYFPWVQDGTMVDTAESCGITPIAQKDPDGKAWNFYQVEQLQQPVKIKPVIVIDGVFFQIYKTGIARVWKSLLEEWAGSDFCQHIIVLDRARTAPEIPGIRYRLIPPYDYHSTDADREMLQQVCDQEDADLFISTYYTTPLSTPSVFMAYDMIPEVLEWDMHNPMWQEKHRAIQQASAYLAISENTARDLVRFFPEISPELVRVAACGVKSSFYPANLAEVNSFRTKYGISKPYFLLVGTGGGYKNTILFFQAFAQLYSKQGFDIVCTGSGSLLSPELRAYASGSVVHMLQLSDEELRAAYSGAVSLVYPSKYEGFGLPILEAMACGCPVITCANASIPEVAGEAALYVNDTDSNELTNALCDVQKPEVRNSLISAGLAQAKTFSWSKMAEIVSAALVDATLLPLNLRDINLIIFPDWSQPEESLGIELEQVIRAIATHPDRSYITLLIDTTNISEEEANLFLSGVAMNLLMQEDLDVTEGAELSLVGNLGEMQWKSLLPHLHARIMLENENQEAIAQANVDALQSYELNRFSDGEVGSFFFKLSHKFFQEGRWQEAIEQYQRILASKTGTPELFWRLSQCYKQLRLLDQVFSILQEGIRVYPTDGRLHFTLVIELQRNERTQEAIAWANQASQILPNDYTFKILKHLIVPIIYDSPAEINLYRQRYEIGLQQLIQETSLESYAEKKDALAGIGRLTNFYLSYQAKNDVDLQRQYGNLVHQILAANYPDWIEPRVIPPLQQNNKIRIGYVSAYLHCYSGTLWLMGWLRHHDKQNFEIYCYYTGSNPDLITQQFQDYSDVFHHIPHNLEAVGEQIIADKLHILVFPEIGMDAPTLQMAALRLAPVQCTAWGHPVTSGLPTVDYFLSSELMEPENAQEHYSETLIRLPNIGVSYPKPYIPPRTKTRADYQLPEEAVLYLCCQAPSKYLPQYDYIFAEIARRVPQARFLFLRGELLQSRLERAFSAVGFKYEEYCLFLTIPERFDYLMINLLSDVYLDTLDWSGGNTSLEAIACHLPIVTYPGEFMRGRHSDSFLKMIGVTDTIAEDEAEYIEIAVKLGLDSAWRQDIAERMKENHERLFDDKVCVAGLEAFYKQVVQERLK
jgi:predicted O-linked N-acetylglucosamine transferase (SPINDLY family)/glycosyltransferase involved in cell wall biosynthesis/predicted O-methyltransferase YrrM